MKQIFILIIIIMMANLLFSAQDRAFVGHDQGYKCKTYLVDPRNFGVMVRGMF